MTARRSARFPLALTMLVIASAFARADGLDANQQRRLVAMSSATQQLETNLKLAEQAAGAGDAAIPATKARLVQARLGQPKGVVPRVREQLSQLPADAPEVAALRARLDAADAAIAALEARLGVKPTPPSTGTPLDYKQQKELADGRSYVNEVVGLAAAIAGVVKEVEAADPQSLDHRRVQTAMNTVTRARERATLAHQHLDALPADGAGVRPVLDQLAVALASVDASEVALKPIHERLQALVDPSSYPNFDADLKRLRELAAMYGNAAQVFAGQRAKAVILVGELPGATAERTRIVAIYAPLVAQATEAGKSMDAASRFCAEALAAFSATADAERQSLPAALDSAFAELTRLTETAIREHKPAFFSGGIPGQVAEIEQRVALLTALDGPAGHTAAARLAAARTKLVAQRATLTQEIIDGNEMPPDRYTGADRSAAEQEAVAAWRAVQPAAEVIAIRIPSTAWERETMWRRQGTTWYRIDRSRLQVQLLVARDATLAVVRPVNLWIDHQAGDRHSAVPMDDLKAAPEPMWLLRRDKIR